MSESTAAPEATPSTPDQDVDAHVPAPTQTVTYQGPDGPLEFRVAPMRVRQVFPFLKLARPLFAALASKPNPASPSVSGLPLEADAGEGKPQGGDLTDDAIARTLQDADWILDMLEQHGPTVVQALACGIDADASKIGELYTADLLNLGKRFVQVNADFFVAQGMTLPQILPAFSPGAMAGRAAAVGTLGRG